MTRWAGNFRPKPFGHGALRQLIVNVKAHRVILSRGRLRPEGQFASFLRGISLKRMASEIPGWIFLGALIYAPWAYGGTTPRSIIGLEVLLGTALSLWLLGLALRRRRPRVPFGLLLAVAAILALGWFMVLNAAAIYDPEFESFVPLAPKRPFFGPTSVDQVISAAWMVRITLLLGVICFVSDLCMRPTWILRLWITVGIAGGSIALLGLLQKATGAVLPFWEYRPGGFSSFFATYYYHGNAGAFLNLVFPLTVGLTLRSLRKHGAPVQRAIWFTAMLLVLAGMLVNTSRAAQFLGALMIAALLVGPARRALRRATAANRLAVASTVAVTGLVLFAIAQASGVNKPVQRWVQAMNQLPTDERWETYRLALRAARDAGWFGFGPGTFRVIFPYYEQVRINPEARGGWRFLHQDYLQTILEWGWIGGACWAVLFLGGIGVGFLALRRLREVRTASYLHRALSLALIALGTIAFHALVDFPLQIFSLQLYAATYLGLCWGSHQLAAADRQGQFKNAAG